MIGWLRTLLTKKKQKPALMEEWYCTYCGHDGWMHDSEGKLIGKCPKDRSPCPLDWRVRNT